LVASNVTVTASAIDPGGNIIRVDFYQNGALIGSANAAPYTVVWNNVPNGLFALTAKATDNLGATATSVPVMVMIRKSPNTVGAAKGLANSIIGDFNWDGSGYPGAGDGALSNSAAVTADLATLTNEIHQACIDFNAEMNLFDQTGSAIATQLQAALYFARADLALAPQSGPSPSLKAHLERLVGHLSMTEDLMLYGSITPATLQYAASVGARPDLVIGVLNSGYSPAANGFVAPASLGSIFGNSAQSPLSGQTTFATLSADQSLPYELSGVSVSVAGQAVPVFYVSPTRVSFFVPIDLPIGEAQVLVVSQNGYVSAGTIRVMPNVTRIMTATEDETGSILGVNGAKQTVDDLEVTTPENFGADKRTRLTIFATGVSGSAANTDTTNDLTLGGKVILNLRESVNIEAHTQDGRVFDLPVEFAGKQGGFPGLDQITVLLIPALQGAGTVDLTLVVNGQRSNAPTIVVH